MHAGTQAPPSAPAAAEPLRWRRLAGRATTVAVLLATLAALAETLGTVVAGRLAGSAAAGVVGSLWDLVGVLTLLLVGAALLDTAAGVLLSDAIGHAERRLRADLLRSAFGQPLSRLQEQAVGEVIDRVDDDVNQAGRLLRTTGANFGRAMLRSVLAWMVAGLTLPAAWIAFPVAAALTFAAARPGARLIAERKLREEEAWSEHAAQLEEAVAGRDDVRSSLGQAHVVRQYALRSSELLTRVRSTSVASGATTRWTGLVLHALLAALAIGGVALVSRDSVSVAALVTVWLLASSFVGQLSNVAHQLPEIQSGIGALTRIRGLLDMEQEVTAGSPLPSGPLDVRFQGVDFAYPIDPLDATSESGGFALRGVTLHVPAGTSVALVGRTGSGKSTLAALLPRAIEPAPGQVLLGGQDVTATDLRDLRRGVGVVTQRTELLRASLLDNITMFADVPRAQVEAAVEELGLREWVDGLPDGLDTDLGASGTGGVVLSAGEEQLVAFARLLVRDVRVVVLDEATARMDPETERRVVQAAERLLAGRTGLVVAHRLATTERCESVAVLERGRVVQHGTRATLAREDGHFRALLLAAGAGAGTVQDAQPEPPEPSDALTRTHKRRDVAAAQPQQPSLWRSVLRLLRAYPRYGLLGGIGFGASSIIGVHGALSGWLWGGVVADLSDGRTPWTAAVALMFALVLAPPVVGWAIAVYPLWWVGVTMRMRLNVLVGQTRQQRLQPTPPGEVTARALDSDRLVWYADRWVDVALAVVAVAATTALSGSLLALAVVGGVLVLSAAASAAGAPLAGRAAREAGDQRAAFGTSLASALDAGRTVKLAAADEAVQTHLQAVDRVRIAAHVREQRVRMLLAGVPTVLLQLGIVSAWAAYAAGTWGVATAVLVSTAVGGFQWFGIVMAATVTEAPVARRWLEATAELAGMAAITEPVPGVDVHSGLAPTPPPVPRVPLQTLRLDGLTAIHEDGTVGVEGVDLTVERGAVVLLAGRVGAGKSSLLRSLAGLVDHEGKILWNDEEVAEPQDFLRPGQVAYVGQVPRVLSASFHDNVVLDHDRTAAPALETARLGADLAEAGGDGAMVGHRGVRLSGGQVQRLALARALAADAELLVADDVSSALDARTELELWEALRAKGVTVIGTSSKRSALSRADRVVVLEDGEVVAQGPWLELVEEWGHLAG